MSKPIVFLSALLFLFSCQSSTRQIPEPGKVLILFDDYNIDNWEIYKDSLKKYGIHATFYVSQFDQMNPQQRQGLAGLKNAGHEIAYHTLHHPELNPNSKLDEVMYLQTEIDSGIKMMEKAGFKPACFAFPGDVYTTSIRDSVQSRFMSVRKGSFGYFEYWERRREYQLKTNQPEDFMCYDIGLNSRFADDDNMRMMAEDIANGKNVALLLHSFDDSTSIYTTPSEEFFRMIRIFQQSGARYNSVCEFFFPDAGLLYTAK